jgi:hypothetical protein
LSGFSREVARAGNISLRPCLALFRDFVRRKEEQKEGNMGIRALQCAKGFQSMAHCPFTAVTTRHRTADSTDIRRKVWMVKFRKVR